MINQISTLIDTAIDPAAAQVIDTLTAVSQTLVANGEYEAAARAAQALQVFTQAQMHGNNFIDTSEVGADVRARTELAALQGAITKLDGVISDPVQRAKLADTKKIANDFSKAFEEAARATVESDRLIKDIRNGPPRSLVPIAGMRWVKWRRPYWCSRRTA